MDVDNTNLTKQELDFLIERLSRDSDDLIVSDVDSGESATRTEVIDLKTRLQRRVEDLRANNENVPPDLMRLLERL